MQVSARNAAACATALGLDHLPDGVVLDLGGGLLKPLAVGVPAVVVLPFRLELATAA